MKGTKEKNAYICLFYYSMKEGQKEEEGPPNLSKGGG